MIYLDNAATTRMYDEVIDIEKDFEKKYFANPSALHSFGMDVENKVKEARDIIASNINCNSNEIYFTKGATESNNIIISSLSNEKNKALTTKLEHSSVIDAFENSSFKKVDLINNDKFGFVNLKDLEEKIDDDTKLVSIIYVQNEIGSIQNIKKISEIIKAKNKDILFHIDATQAFGKISCDINELGVDSMSFSSHKIHGPKGIGGLYISNKFKNRIKPVLYGGRQEVFSSGTLNAPAICAFSKALELSKEKEDFEYIKNLNIYLRNKITDIFKGFKINSPTENSSPYILNISFEKIKSEVLLHMLESNNIFVSSGSACSKGNNSRILSALNLDKKYMDGALRFSFSHEITKKDLDFLVNKLNEYVDVIRKVY